MEASGAVSMITALYNDQKCVLSTLVGDNDSTTHSNAKHSIKAVMELNNKAVHWPKTKGGSYTANNGKLPLHVIAINFFLADPLHHDKSFGCALYKVEKKWQRELKFMAVDCKHLKRKYNFWQWQNKCETYDIFQHHYCVVIDHHFGDHSCCQCKEDGGWCKFKNNDELKSTKGESLLQQGKRHHTLWLGKEGLGTFWNRSHAWPSLSSFYESKEWIASSADHTSSTKG